MEAAWVGGVPGLVVVGLVGVSDVGEDWGGGFVDGVVGDFGGEAVEDAERAGDW